MSRTKAGFTIIEILIVLAIGAIILSIVIIGLHGAEQNQRDSARKANVNGLVGAINEYANSHNNVYPVCTMVNNACAAPLPLGWTWTEPISGVSQSGPQWSWIMWNPGAPSYSVGSPCEKPQDPLSSPQGYVTTPLAAGGYYCVLY